jgi:hypothetical protein
LHGTRGFILAQAVGLLGTAVLVGALKQPQLIWFVFPGLFISTYLWSKTRGQPCSRAEVKELVMASGLVFGLLTGAGFGLAVWTFPDSFDIPATSLPGLSIFMGLGGGLATVIVSLVALDTTGIA